MDPQQFPGNSGRQASRREPAAPETKKVERVVSGSVTRRKTPLSRRMTQSLIGGDVQSVWGYVFGEVLIPAARDTIADAVTGGVERMIFPDSPSSGRRTRSRGSRTGHVSYDRYSSPTGRNIRSDEPRRELSRRTRELHSFDEIIVDSRVEAEEVLDRLFDLVDRYENASVADLYGLLGATAKYTDEKWGWFNLAGARVERVRNGYLISLPKPEPID